MRLYIGSQQENDGKLYGEVNKKPPLWWIMPAERWLEGHEQTDAEAGITQGTDQ